jgi:hypothetical protein
VSLSALSDEEEIKSFLETANVIDMQKIPEGITGARKVTLEKEGIRKAAVFRCVDVYPRKKGPLRYGARDYHLYECAAYELSKMLGLSIIPPVVQREINGERGTLQIWIEDSVMEKELLELGKKPPDQASWDLQKQTMAIFDNLIFNTDRHLGNILVERDWRLWCIDHTRAFRTFIHLRSRKTILHCRKELWDNLRMLDEKTQKEGLSKLLTKEEIRTLEKRRKKLIDYIEELIEEHGEAHVIVE